MNNFIKFEEFFKFHTTVYKVGFNTIIFKKNCALYFKKFNVQL